MTQSRDPVVSCDWLAERLHAPDIRIVDATWLMPGDSRSSRDLYDQERIPGAIFFDIDEIADRQSTLPHMLPPPERFASRMRKMGIGDGTRVVVYDTLGVFSSPRVWWTFRVMGHEDVVVLDGGFPAWRRAGLPIETGPPNALKERHFTVRKRLDLVRDLNDVRRAVERADAAILDARPPARFRGEAPEPRPGLRGGHIPLATNAPSATLVTEDGYLKPREDLLRLLGAHTDGSRPIICTCGSGITAAVIALALARIGRWDAAVYDGSWAEWGALPDTPVVTGP